MSKASREARKTLRAIPRTAAPQLSDESTADEARGFPVGAAALLALQGNLGPGSEEVLKFLRVSEDLLATMADAEAMDNYPLLSSALDIYADDATQADSQTGRVAWVTSPDEDVQLSLDSLLRHVMRVDTTSWGRVRGLVKYGNHYWEPVLGESGVQRVVDLPPASMRRVENERGTLKGFLQSFSPRALYTPNDFDNAVREYRSARSDDAQYKAVPAIPFEPWRVIHTRLMGRDMASIYGSSIFQGGARWAWRRLLLMDDSALMFRLTRAPERMVYYLDCGTKSDAEALAYCDAFRRRLRKKKIVDSSGKTAYRYDPVSVDEDIIIPTRAGSETRIENMAGPVWQSMDDVDYFKTMLFGAIKIPRAYLGDETGVVRATLSSQDVRFARTTMRVQQEYKQGLTTTCDVHLLALGVDPSSVEYDVEMSAPSSIFELAQLEVRNARADYAQRIGAFVDFDFVLREIFHLPKEQIAVILKGRATDLAREGGMGGGGGGDGEGGGPPGMDSGGPPGPGEPGYQAQQATPAAESMRRKRDDAELKRKLDRVLSEDRQWADRMAGVEKLLKEVASLTKQSMGAPQRVQRDSRGRVTPAPIR